MFKYSPPIKQRLAGFMRWWLGELGFLIPVRIRDFLTAPSEYRVLRLNDGRLSLDHLIGSNSTELAHFTLDEPAPSPGSGDERLSEPPLALALNRDLALKRMVRLPAAMEENLYQAMGYEMDRLTPFRPDQVYYGVHISERLTTTRQILVELVLTPRQRLDDLLNDLTRQGWQPAVVYLADDGAPGHYNLLPDHYRTKTVSWPRIANWSLGAVIATILLMMTFLPLFTASAAITRLESETGKLSKQAKEVEALREENEKLTRKSSFLQDKKFTEPAMVDMLEELSQLIPDATWLDGLQYRDHRVVIQGHSPSASTLIEALETSAYFGKVNFLSPVTKDISNGLERFQISFEVTNGRFTKKPE